MLSQHRPTPLLRTTECALLLAWMAFSAATFAQTTVQAKPADQFVDSMGVNVHLESSKAPYHDYGAINGYLRVLGMRHVRDEINDTDESFVREIQKIGDLGYSLCGLIEGGNDYPGLGKKLDPNAVVPMIHNLRPTIEAVEGPNEPDDGGFYYGEETTQYPKGVPYPPGAIDESVDLWNIVKDSSEISDLPVVVMSEGNAPDFKVLARRAPMDYATYGNMHAYQGGDVGDHRLADWYIRYSRDLTGSAPLWTTEMGYHNNTSYLVNGEQQGVSQRASAIYLPIAFLSGFDHGVMRTFSYELIDEQKEPPPDCSGQSKCSGEGYYGLLNYDGTAKPAFTALQNLITLLREPEPADFEPGSLIIKFSGAPATMRYTLLEKSNGAYYLALWNDVRVYQLAHTKSGKIVPGIDVYPPTVSVTLTFSSSKTFTVYAPNDESGTHPTNAYTTSKNLNAIRLALPPEVLLIKVVDKNEPNS